MSVAPLRYLSAADVKACMPGVADRLELARQTMVALVENAELPPKLGVHPRPAGSLTGAMPAMLRGPNDDGTEDLLGMKWVTGFPGNRARGLDAIYALVVLNDATTGVPVGILDGRPITAERTAAVSGVALQHFLPLAIEANDPVGATVALVGGGAQGNSHVEVLAHVMPGSRLTICDRHQDRAEALAAKALATASFDRVRTATDPVAAVRGAKVVLTMVSFGPEHQILPADALADASLIVGVDYDMCVPQVVAKESRTFLVDEVPQFLATRKGNYFAGYPDPDGSIGEALLGRAPEPRDAGPVYVNHLGVGLADVIFGHAILRRAVHAEAGVELPR